jgi:hypothetical protein
MRLRPIRGLEPEQKKTSGLLSGAERQRAFRSVRRQNASQPLHEREPRPVADRELREVRRRTESAASRRCPYLPAASRATSAMRRVDVFVARRARQPARLRPQHRAPSSRQTSPSRTPKGANRGHPWVFPCKPALPRGRGSGHDRHLGPPGKPTVVVGEGHTPVSAVLMPTVKKRQTSPSRTPKDVNHGLQGLSPA